MKVKMNTDGIREYIAQDIDAACHFVGDFAWCAREQGWSDEEILRVVRPVTAKRAYQELLPYIEYVPPSVPPPPDPSDATPKAVPFSRTTRTSDTGPFAGSSGRFGRLSSGAESTGGSPEE